MMRESVALLAGAALGLLGASAPETQVKVRLSEAIADDASGRLLLFVEPAEANSADAVDVGDPAHPNVFVAARDVTGFGKAHIATIDAEQIAFPHGLAELPPGPYRVQAVLDRDGSYNYGGRGPGDLVSKVVSVRLPLVAMPTLELDHVVPAALDQFDVTGVPPRAAEQILASRPHLHDERIASPLLTRFHHSKQIIAAWVLTPPGYDPKARRTYPVVYTAGGFGATHKLDGQQLSRQWHLMETGEIPPMIWVALDYSTLNGTTEFADSANNGPWDRAFVTEVVPALEARYRMDARPSGRFLTGHSSGGWFAIWAMIQHPAMFGGAWATSPDPVDFHDFIGVDLYARGANMYRDAHGAAKPLQRDHGSVSMTIEQAARLEVVLGRTGGQLQSFDWVFSPGRADGSPAGLFDRATGNIDPVVAAYWRDRYDIGRLARSRWPISRKLLDGKLNVTVGTADSYFLDGSVRRLEAAIEAVGGRATFTYVPQATHSMSEVYSRSGDRNALWKDMATRMYAIARPFGGSVTRR